MTMEDLYNPDEILDDPDAHPVHKMYAAINIGIRDRGERWGKCPNCGRPYQIVTAQEATPLMPEWTSETVCSVFCGNEYARYLMSGEL